jgi:hypothetical protein
LAWAGWLFMLNVLWVRLRGAADDVGFPVQDDGLEQAIFGGLPGVWLQRPIHDAAPALSEWAAVVIYTSWFIVPIVAGLFVSVRAPRRIGSFFSWWVGVYYVGLIAFVLFPMAPPWMADSEVKRLAVLAVGPFDDNNEVAAMPSLHVALPIVLGLWFRREQMTTPAALMFAYGALISLEVVIAGEHYVVDVIGAIAAAVAVSVIMPRLVVAGRRAVARAQDFWRARPAFARSLRSESGQALIELALVLPLMFVILAVLVDGGLAVDRRVALQHAVREGARLGAIGAAETDIIDRTVDQSGGLLGTGDVDVCYVDGSDGNSSAGDPGDSVRVSAMYTYQFTLGSGELLEAMGSDVPSIDMNPATEFLLEASVAGASAC